MPTPSNWTQLDAPALVAAPSAAPALLPTPAATLVAWAATTATANANGAALLVQSIPNAATAQQAPPGGEYQQQQGGTATVAVSAAAAVTALAWWPLSASQQQQPVLLVVGQQDGRLGYVLLPRPGGDDGSGGSKTTAAVQYFDDKSAAADVPNNGPVLRMAWSPAGHRLVVYHAGAGGGDWVTVWRFDWDAAGKVRPTTTASTATAPNLLRLHSYPVGQPTSAVNSSPPLSSGQSVAAGVQMLVIGALVAGGDRRQSSSFVRGKSVMLPDGGIAATTAVEGTTSQLGGGRIVALVWGGDDQQSGGRVGRAGSTSSALPGNVLMAVDDRGMRERVAHLNAAVVAVVYDGSGAGNQTVLALTADMVISQFHLEADGRLAMERQIKLSSSSGANRTGSIDTSCMDMVLVDSLTVAVVSGGATVRILNLNTDESTELVIPNTENTRINCVAFSSGAGVLSAGTDSGHVQMWQKMAAKKPATVNQPQRYESPLSINDGYDWVAVTKVNIGGAIERLLVDPSGQVQIVRKKNSAKILVRQNMFAALFENVSVIQLSGTRLQLSRHQLGGAVPTLEYTHDGAPIRKVSLARGGSLALWDGEHVNIVQVSEKFDSYERMGRVACAHTRFCLGEQSLFTVAGDDKTNVDVWNYQGIRKQKLALGDHIISCLDICSNSLIARMHGGFVTLIDVSRREARIAFGPKLISTEISNDSQVQCNSIGSLISYCQPNASDLSLYDAESGATIVWHCETGAVISHHWDFKDPRVLIVECQTAAEAKSSSIVTLLVSKGRDSAQKLNEISIGSQKVLGCHLPHVYGLFTKIGENAKSFVDAILLPEFAGVTISQAHIIKAIIDFSEYLLCGNFDDALKTIKTVDAPVAWENFAKKCVSSRDIELAMFCLGMTGNAMLIQTMRRFENDSKHVQAAVLSALLGDLAEAESILRDQHEYSKLVHLLQVLGEWERAENVANSFDRIAVKNVHYEHAKQLEASEDFMNAADFYDKSKTAGFEIPRMLLSRPAELSSYIQASADKKLKNWLAHYAESQGEYETARMYYEESGDIHSLVRNLCQLGRSAEAAQVAEQVNDAAACFFLARLEEENGNNKDAIEWYSKAKCYNHASRIAKDNQMDQDLMQLAFVGPVELMVDIANYFEERGLYEKAVNLYHKAGLTSKAVDLCVQTRQDNMLEMMSVDLQSTNDPVVLEKCAQLFVARGDFEKAVAFMLKARKIDEAIVICNERNIVITDEMADKIAPFGDGVDADKVALSQLAELCEAQGSFHLASKKFAQSGDRIRALKALFKSGDVEKIIFFASVSGARQKELYVMTANYLSTLKWHDNMDILKAIISFYTKGKAFDSLASFYESCAQLEIDEFSNYEKAVGAYQEAVNCLEKVAGSAVRISSVKRKMDIIHQFLSARNVANVSPNDAIATCEQLISAGDETAVRVADVFALLIEVFYKSGSKNKATAVLHRMKTALPSVDLSLYVDPNILRDLAGAEPFPFSPTGVTARTADEIEEDIVE